MTDLEKVIKAIENAKKQSVEYAQDYILVPLRETDMILTLLKEQEAKQPIHVHEEFKEHDWYRDKDGEIDEFAFDVDYHNGPMCKRCDYSFCKHCEPNGWNKKPCIIDFYQCPKCKTRIAKGTMYCARCGQAVKWND